MVAFLLLVGLSVLFLSQDRHSLINSQWVAMPYYDYGGNTTAELGVTGQRVRFWPSRGLALSVWERSKEPRMNRVTWLDEDVEDVSFVDRPLFLPYTAFVKLVYALQAINGDLRPRETGVPITVLESFDYRVKIEDTGFILRAYTPGTRDTRPDVTAYLWSIVDSKMSVSGFYSSTVAAHYPRDSAEGRYWALEVFVAEGLLPSLKKG